MNAKQKEILEKCDEQWTLAQFNAWQRSGIVRSLAARIVDANGYYYFIDSETAKLIYVTK